jgi:RNA polymerase sigma-70 factor (ECF subfamily)
LQCEGSNAGVWTAGSELSPAVLEAFRRGEEEAVGAVYRRYGGPVYAVAMSVLGDHDLAGEAAQETFVRAWRAAPRYRSGDTLAPWLFTIARRVAIDMWRLRQRFAGQPPAEDAILSPPPDLDAVWEAYQVRAAVNRLPDEERVVVLLHHFKQLSHTEIAARLGIPVGTVKSRSYRAHRRLAEWLRPLYPWRAPARAA